MFWFIAEQQHKGRENPGQWNSKFQKNLQHIQDKLDDQLPLEPPERIEMIRHVFDKMMRYVL
jgi:hypothetical protein